MSGHRSKQNWNKEASGINEVRRIFTDDFGWIVRDKREDDFGIDLEVEVCDDLNPTGRLIAIQVKSGASYVKKETPTLLIEQRHFDYWTNYSLPVIVILHNPDSRRTLWNFANTKTCTKTRKNWKIEFPATYNLSTKFETDLRKAAASPTLEETISREKDKYEVLDPRFEFTVELKNNKVCRSFAARENVDISLALKGTPENLHEKYETLVEKGHRVTFQKDEILFSGSPIFDEMQSQFTDEIQVQMAHRDKLTCTILTLDNQKMEVVRVPDFPVLLTAGQSVAQLEGKLDESPLAVNIEIDSRAHRKGGHATISFDSSAWIGKPLLTLPYFEQILAFEYSIVAGDSLHIECSRQGNRVFSHTVNEQSSLSGEAFTRVLYALEKARWIAEYLQLNPIVPQNLSMHHLGEIDILYALLQDGEVSTFKSNLEFTTSIAFKKGAQEVINKTEDAGPISISPVSNLTLPFLSENPILPPMSFSADPVYIKSKRKILQEGKATDQELFEITFAQKDECKITRKLLVQGS